jgi:DNA-binding NtrC family response regulator
MQRLCLVEDDEIMRTSLYQRFKLEEIACDCFDNAQAALASLEGGAYAALISDIRMPDMSGEELFARLLQSEKGPPPTVFITAYGTIDQAVDLLKLGASDYVTKPFDIDELLIKLRQIAPQLFGLAEESGTELGISPQMRQVKSLLDRLAEHDVDVLITGETGVGKEYAARYLATKIDREQKKPFIALNCASLPEDLLETELFGHEKGAFTGALRSRRGMFEQADGGILFLDEIGETSPRMQSKLLRTIQERTVRRVGSEETIPFNARLIYATNRDLKAMVSANEFREDLYFRINVAHVHIPPLRERREDIGWLAHQIVDRFTRKQGQRRLLLPLTEHYLEQQPWNGNLRELANAVERACIMSAQEVLGPREFNTQDASFAESNEEVHLKEAIERYERTLLLETLQLHHWRIAESAQSLGISRKSLWEKMRRYEIEAKK